MSTEKTLDILDLFDLNDRALTVAQISEKIKQPQSSVYRYVRLLRERDLLREERKGFYSLGYKMLKYYRILRLDSNLAVIAEEEMKKLTSELNETSILLVPSNLQAVCIATVSSQHKIKVTSEPGEILPLYGGASSKSLLAYLDERVLESLYTKTEVLAYTENTITSLSEMKAHLQEIRNKGYAFSDSEIDESVVGYGVPIFDSNNTVVASLSVAGLKDNMLKKDSKKIVQSLKETAEKIQKYL
ncbi:IclR family transcriptional regulator [Sporosarcina psychrophila]|uniref:DNA-binding IclR family transcriptional regulator n=1 Tax=Sporosarcina psychrophila TaxID=1476 RepID=A0ABV2K396_SPOPS